MGRAVTLTELRTRTLERAGMEGALDTGALVTAKLDRLINAARFRHHAKIVDCRGGEFVARTATFSTAVGQAVYALETVAPLFAELLGRPSLTDSGRVRAMRSWDYGDLAALEQLGLSGSTGSLQLRYRITATDFEIQPPPQGIYSIKLRYVPRCLKLAAVASGAVSLTFTENSPAADTIGRASGSWITDGFEASMRFITGSVINPGPYTIAALTSSLITLIATDDVANEGPVASTASTVIPLESELSMDGDLGFDEWIVLSVAIALRSEQEWDVADLMNERALIDAELAAIKSKRDAASPPRIVSRGQMHSLGRVGPWRGLCDPDDLYFPELG